MSWAEQITVKAPVSRVYDDIRMQSHLMAWSAWPAETNSDCMLEGEDGKVGARTVFLSKKGERFGFQEVTRLLPDRLVELTLHGGGPFPQKPRVTFDLSPLEPGRVKSRSKFQTSSAATFFGAAASGFPISDSRATKIVPGRRQHDLRPRMSPRYFRANAVMPASRSSIRRRPESSSRASYCRRVRKAPFRSPLLAA